MHRMTRAEFARHMNVNRSTVTRWIERGRLVADVHGLIDVDAAKVALQATESPEPHHQARIAQIAEQKAQGALPAASRAQDATDAGLRLKLAMAAEREAKAELAAMERDRQAGLLVDRQQVDFVLDDFGSVLRALVDGLVDRLPADLAKHRGDLAALHKTVEDAGHDLLSAVADHMARRMAQLRDDPR